MKKVVELTRWHDFDDQNLSLQTLDRAWTNAFQLQMAARQNAILLATALVHPDVS